MRRRLFVLMPAAVVLALAFVVWPREREPEYRRIKLSGWLRMYQENGTLPDPVEVEDVRRAIRHMGTNSLPFLIDWLSYESPPWREKLGSLYCKVPSYLRSSSVSDSLYGARFIPSRNAIIWSFFVLGAEAEPALPRLDKLVRSNDRAAMPATMCMGCVGEPAIPKLQELLRCTNAEVRCTARMAIKYMVPHDGWLRTNFETGFAGIVIWR